MEIFSLLFIKLLPLYAYIALGFSAGKFFKIETAQIATLVIYIIMPFVFLIGLWQADIQFANISIFLIIWILSFTIMILSYALGHVFYGNNVKNLIASGLPTGNSGYFGIPVALAVFEPALFGIYLLAAISNTMFQITFGYYTLALGNFDWKASLKKLLGLPAIYGTLAGIFLSVSNVPLPQIVVEFNETLKGTFVVLGMMIIGLTLSSFKDLKFDFKFLSLAMAIRFLIWPLIGFSFILLDRYLLNNLFVEMHPIIILFSFLPIAADFAIYANNINLYPACAAMAIFVSTILAAIIIPLVYALS